MLRTHVNYFLAVLYRRNQATMKFTSDSGVVVIAKLQLGVLLFFYVYPITGALGRFWTHRETDLHLTSSNYLDSVLLAGAFFVPVHLLAWPTARLVAFAADEENQSIMQQAQQTLLVLLIIGFILLIVLAKYNVGTL
ncbi:hypothetical protein [Hymenobacter sp. BT770]|uniref:hypothetical protein n=1 Tax=Hymenobacter sp. BT770 TaxID=2886942 RepID=UPI001D11FDDF|nr:hypothetical protein [Hymenobacter sp. BT770]MCC3155551.1 hypothetical protein [Hymenobacter sp. BT770]